MGVPAVTDNPWKKLLEKLNNPHLFIEITALWLTSSVPQTSQDTRLYSPFKAGFIPADSNLFAAHISVMITIGLGSPYDPHLRPPLKIKE